VATHDYVIANGTGAAVRSDLNGALAAIVSQNSNASAPATTYAYMSWADTSAGVMKMRNGANSAWISLYELDGTFLASDISLAAGSAAAPSLFFTGDTNTGLYSPGADQIGIATGGTSRLVVDASGNVNIDSNTLYVDAANNRVGIANSAPTSSFHVGGGLASTQSPVTYLSAENGSLAVACEIRQGRFDKDVLVLSTNQSLSANLFNAIENGTSRFVITGAGNVGVATTSPTSSLHVGGGLASTQSPVTYLSAENGTNKVACEIRQGRFDKDVLVVSSNQALSANLFNAIENGTSRFLVTGGGSVGVGIAPSYQLQLSTDSAGKPSTNTWTIVSDERIKEDIELADLSLCYQAVKDIPLKRYKWKDEVYTEDQVHDRRKLGWISQDVKAVFPKAVRISEFKYNQVFSETVIPAVDEKLDEDGNVVISAEPERIEKELVSEDIIEDCHDLNVDQLYAAMYGAIQMLMAKVEALETSNADLLARVTALEAA